MNENRDMPIGRDYLRAACDLERIVEAKFQDWLATEAKVSGSDIVEAIGTALSFLDTIPSCSYGCELSDGGHLEMHLLARVNSTARASTRLLLSGYFLEALVLIRKLVEIIDLLCLFMQSEESLERFRNASAKARWDKFKPSKVRGKLKQLLSENYPDELMGDYYGFLSRLAVHNFSTTNFSRNVCEMFADAETHGTVTVTKADQVVTLVALNQVADTVSAALLLASELLDQPQGRQATLNMSKKLSEVVRRHKAVVETL